MEYICTEEISKLKKIYSKKLGRSEIISIGENFNLSRSRRFVSTRHVHFSPSYYRCKSRSEMTWPARCKISTSLTNCESRQQAGEERKVSTHAATASQTARLARRFLTLFLRSLNRTYARFKKDRFCKRKKKKEWRNFNDLFVNSNWTTTSTLIIFMHLFRSVIVVTLEIRTRNKIAIREIAERNRVEVTIVSAFTTPIKYVISPYAERKTNEPESLAIASDLRFAPRIHT